ncbi:NAD(P)/FAD-dependent oxidoreductase [Marinobacter changyiensis]|uniref:NAD(P)/FAD-dependent oxidoreductase n=1 Tax=Marinobacter changyiensis TaxID=2604091 RepID=UPI001FE274DC|nr:FAD-dependent oxidoreductase [Marinobacter changyiensis]
MSGLAAALLLKASAVEVTLFEKSRGPGGRLAAKRLPDSLGGGSADIGAQYFTIRNPGFRELLERYVGPEHYTTWSARLRYQSDSGEWGLFKDSERYVGLPRMTAISRALSESLTINARIRIDKFERIDDDQWRLRDTEGKDHGCFDAVIITAPPAQSRDLLAASGLTGLSQFLEPHVSQMQACWTVVARFPHSLGLDYDGFQPKSDILQWAANNSSKPGREGIGEWWVLHGRPDWSDQYQNGSPEFVTEALVGAFAQATGVVEQPDHILTHRWLYAKSAATEGPGHLWFNDERIGVIGDWVQGGRVEGAYESAESLVNRLCSDGSLSPNTQDTSRTPE